MSGAPDDDDFDFEDEDELPPEDDQDDLPPEDDEDDLPPEDDEDLPPEDDEPPPERQRGRGESRVAKLAREARELRDEVAALKRNQTAAPAQPDPQPRETQEQFQARLAAMDPVDRVAYLQQLGQQHTQAELQRLQFQIADTSDKTTFDAYAAGSKAAKGLAAKVEQRLADYRKQGVNIPRMDVLKHLLGERALEQSTRSRTRAERGAEERRSRQAARPPSSRSDTSGEGRDTDKSKAARDRRLENLKI